MTTAQAVYRELGLTDDEHDAIIESLGRVPSYTELAMFSVMWSEHCSYKSSRVELASLPTEGERVLVGPGEGAGIIEVEPGVAVAWKIESHNHPSFVEPGNGAATGVGGIVRDVLSMGARPIALLDSLRFGPLEDAGTRFLLEGVVSGISSYGNSIGVPTVGGECLFEDCYRQNPLVNVACLGVIEERVMRGRADHPGDALVLFGSATGRDGIGGASVLASAEFGDDAAAKRPSVQVGDPFTEKLLIEVALELVNRGLVTGLQDLGAGGLSCPVAEMASKSGTGMELDADIVHLREPGMEPFEIMISESQERMLATVTPERLDEVLEVCARWGLMASVPGRVTSTGRITVVAGGQEIAGVPAPALADEAPVYHRPSVRPPWAGPLQFSPSGETAPESLEEALLALLASPGIASKEWVWEQYDHMIGLGTIEGPGGDAAVIRLPGRRCAVALSVDGPGRYCQLDPYEGARLAVAEAARNVACTGARPAAVTNCLNLGSPERSEVMWQLSEIVRGIKDACLYLETPVTGGNVSFYNETSGRSIYPTPVIGMLGILEEASMAVGPALGRDGDVILLLGKTDGNDFGGSEYAQVFAGALGGRPPRLDLASEKALHAVLVRGAASGRLASAHDPSAGGVAVALTEAALAGGRGFRLSHPGTGSWRWLFSESPGRAVVSCRRDEAPTVEGLARELGVEARHLGTVCGDQLDFGPFKLSLERAREGHRNGFTSRLSTAAALRE